MRAITTSVDLILTVQKWHVSVKLWLPKVRLLGMVARDGC